MVAYNALQVVPDMRRTVAECARVLTTGGHLFFCVGHPATDLGRFVAEEPDGEPPATSYFASTRVDDTVELDGLTMTFRGWTHTIEDYGAALEHSGLVIEAIREPRPETLPRRFERWRQVPLFLNVRAAKR